MKNVIGIELSNQCNLNCGLCARHGRKLPKHYITLKQFKNIKLDEIEAIIYIGGQLGDPLTNPYFLDIIKTTKNWNNQLIIQTNGNFHDEDWWWNLSKYLPNDHSIWFPIDGTDNKTMAIYREGSKYDRVIHNAVSFINGGGNAVWQMIMFEHNKHQFEKAKKLSSIYGFSDFRLIPSIFYNEKYKRPSEDIKSDKEFSNDNRKHRCRIEMNKYQISSKGEYLPCCFYFDNISLPENLKKIDDYSIKEILEDGYYDRILNHVTTNEIEVCKKCILYCGKRNFK
jgi:MoaA/NifB/PqqE/SkfB family radical SAM enzyme